MSAVSPEARRLAALRISRPGEWQDLIVETVRASKGALRAAAKALGVSERTMHRWARDKAVKERLGKLPHPPEFTKEPEQEPSDRVSGDQANP